MTDVTDGRLADNLVLLAVRCELDGDDLGCAVTLRQASKRIRELARSSGGARVCQHCHGTRNIDNGSFDLIQCPHCTSPEPSGKPVPHIATVTDNNHPGWTFIAETAPNVTLPVGTKLYTEAALIAVGAGVAEDIWQREAATATESPSVDELTEYAYVVGIVKRGDTVPFQMLDVLQRQVVAAWSLRRAPEPEAKPEPLRVGDPVRLHTVSILCEQHGWTIEALPPTGLYHLRHKKGSLISVQRCDFSLTKEEKHE